MTDIKTVWDADKITGDWSVVAGGLETGDDLETAILLSLFTDRLARSDDSIDGSDRRGWWGDTDADYPIGSRFWLLKRQKLTTQVATKAEDYAKEALQWLIDDKVVSSITATAQIVYPTRLYLTIVYQQPSKDPVSAKFGWVWEK